MNKYFLIVLLSLVASQLDAMKGNLSSNFISFDNRIATEALMGSLDVFKKNLNNPSPGFGQGFKSPAAAWTIMGALASGGAMVYQGYSYFKGAQTIATGVVAGSEVINKMLEQKEEETSAIKKLADETEAFRKMEEAKNEKAEEALDHVSSLSLMELHMMASSESQSKSGSHYWQDLYNAKRGENPYLAISSNNLDDNKQPENPNQN
jgi:hypothetical protein